MTAKMHNLHSYYRIALRVSCVNVLYYRGMAPTRIHLQELWANMPTFMRPLLFLLLSSHPRKKGNFYIQLIELIEELLILEDLIVKGMRQFDEEITANIYYTRNVII